MGFSRINIKVIHRGGLLVGEGELGQRVPLHCQILIRTPSRKQEILTALTAQGLAGILNGMKKARKIRSETQIRNIEKKRDLLPGAIRNPDNFDARFDKTLGALRKDWANVADTRELG